MKETIIITKEEYFKLLERDRFLTALENSGVDNWDGYEYAIDLLEKWGKEENN